MVEGTGGDSLTPGAAVGANFSNFQHLGIGGQTIRHSGQFASLNLLGQGGSFGVGSGFGRCEHRAQRQYHHHSQKQRQRLLHDVYLSFFVRENASRHIQDVSILNFLNSPYTPFRESSL